MSSSPAAPPFLKSPPSRSAPPSSSESSPSSSNQLPAVRSFFVPPEIIDVIMNSGDWTPHDLTKLARVSKTFLSLVRPLLYQTVFLKIVVSCAGESGGQTDCKLGDNNNDNYQHQCYEEDGCPLTDWSLTLESDESSDAILHAFKEYPHLTSFVDTIDWGCFYSSQAVAALEVDEEREAILRNGDDVVEAITEVAEMLDQCSRLDWRITADYWEWTDELAKALRETKVIHQVTKFAWTGKEIWLDLTPARPNRRDRQLRFKNLSQMFLSLEAVDDLHFGSAEGELSWHGSQRPTFPLRSSSITLGTLFDGRFTSALLANACNTLQLLSIPNYLTAFLYHSFPKLQTLELGFTENSQSVDFPDPQLLSRCPYLHQLSFTFTYIHGDERDERLPYVDFDDPEFEWVPPTLQILSFDGVGIPSSSLTTIINTSNLREIRLQGFLLGRLSSEMPYHHYDWTPASWDYEETEAFYKFCEEKGIKVSSDDGDEEEGKGE